MFGGLSLTHLASTTDLLRNYEIGSEIGSGASATVYNVTEKQSKRPYVMKVISTLGLTDEEQRNVQVEVEALKTANHPNIIMHHESDINEFNCVIIMEKCETTLEAVIDSARVHMESSQNQQQPQVPHRIGRTPPPPSTVSTLASSPFPEDILIEWMAELLSALQYLHKHRIVHRDIKTGNIFVSRKNHLKLGDFGVCTILASAPSAEASLANTPNKGDKDGGESPRGSSQAARTERGAATYSFVGTPFYIAPEVCLGEAWTPQSDVWSLGIVLYELCTLRRPFDGQNVMHLVEAITEGPIPAFPAGHLKDSRFEMIVLSMLNRDPLQRPTVDILLEKYFVLPASHPSHPMMAPTKAREVQFHHGPKLDFPIIEQGALNESLQQSHRGNAMATVQRGWLTPRNTVQLDRPQPSKVVESTRPTDSRRPKELIRPKSAGSNPHPKPASRAKSPITQQTPSKRISGAHLQQQQQQPRTPLAHSIASKPIITRHRDPNANAPPQHSENYKQRIRNVKSTVNIQELRKQMMGAQQGGGQTPDGELRLPGGTAPTPIKRDISQKRSSANSDEDKQRNRSPSAEPSRRPSSAPQKRTPSAVAAFNHNNDELLSSGSNNHFARTQNNNKQRVDFIATPHGFYEIGNEHPTRMDSVIGSDMGEGTLGGSNVHFDMNAVYSPNDRRGDVESFVQSQKTDDKSSPLVRAPSATNIGNNPAKSASASPTAQASPAAEPLEAVLNALRGTADALSINDLDEIALALNRIRVRRFGVY